MSLAFAQSIYVSGRTFIQAGNTVTVAGLLMQHDGVSHPKPVHNIDPD